MMNNDVYEVRDKRFYEVTLPDAELKQISSGHLWTEGPVWFSRQNALLFSDIPNQKIHKWTADGTTSIFRAASNFANGHALDLQGRLVTCEHGTRSVTRTEENGQITTLAASHNDKPLNSPNDVVVKSDGTVWFTDPTYGIKSDYEGYPARQEQEGRYVFRLEPDNGRLDVVATDFTQPNGLAFSKDESLLYIADSGLSDDPEFAPIVRRHVVNDDGTLSDDGIFATMDPGIPDGLRVDEHDNVWISAADGVHCLDKDGQLLGKIKVPEIVSNLNFGGAHGNELFITATSSVYALQLNTKSAIAKR
ncbi:SMP-30/gluconolactonase/LRE family protein [Falsihalocynthiibacter sp. S25ZX9]|uniref:SMP-30/gluconolactonase/LRE family protein n=1 Tax=unclassified Falsihalocynthiibacter TaxID=2854191 RepID=UPI00350F51EE